MEEAAHNICGQDTLKQLTALLQQADMGEKDNPHPPVLDNVKEAKEFTEKHCRCLRPLAPLDVSTLLA